MNTEEKISKIFEKLENAGLERSEFVKFTEGVKDPFIVLITCILSLRTNDKTTYPASQRMLKLGKTPEEISKIPEDVLMKAIYPVGFYKTKAKQIVEISKKICEEHNGKVPESIEEMTKFKGVGRKTANLVVAKGFCKPAICVDVHVHRISNRLGLVKTKTPDETEFALRKIIPEKYQIDLNTEFVTLGQNLCSPTKPKCEKCPIRELCDFGKNTEKH